jgi:hypothetical protein
MLTGNEIDVRKTKAANSDEILGEDNVRRAFGANRKAPALRVLQKGAINSTTAFELACGRVPHTREDFYAVNTMSRRPGIGRRGRSLDGGGLDSWIMAGVFGTLREARTYINRLKSKTANL